MVDATQTGLPPADPLAAAPVRPEGYWRSVWRRLRRDKVAMTAGGVLLFILGLAVFAPWIAPQDPFHGTMLMRLRPIGTEGHILGTDELGRDMHCVSKNFVGSAGWPAPRHFSRGQP